VVAVVLVVLLVLYHHLVQPLLVAQVALVSYGPLLILIMAVVAAALVLVPQQELRAALVEEGRVVVCRLQAQQLQAELVLQEQVEAVVAEPAQDQVVCHHQILAARVVLDLLD
jgi:cell division protein FtsL